MGNIKEINIKNRAYYFFNDMINIKDFHSSLLKIKNHTKVSVFTIKKNNDYENINSVNSFYLMIGEVIEHIENNGNKYLIFDSVDENKEVLKKYKELWDGIKKKIENINDGESKYS